MQPNDKASFDAFYRQLISTDYYELGNHGGPFFGLRPVYVGDKKESQSLDSHDGKTRVSKLTHIFDGGKVKLKKQVAFFVRF